MSAPRTSAAIAERMDEWREKKATQESFSANDIAFCREVSAALRKEPPAPHFSLQEREMTQTNEREAAEKKLQAVEALCAEPLPGGNPAIVALARLKNIRKILREEH